MYAAIKGPESSEEPGLVLQGDLPIPLAEVQGSAKSALAGPQPMASGRHQRMRWHSVS